MTYKEAIERLVYLFRDTSHAYSTINAGDRNAIRRLQLEVDWLRMDAATPTDNAAQQYTPGPWQVTPGIAPMDNDSLCIETVYDGVDGCHIAYVFKSLPWDAQLIAAAPEMIEVLRSLLCFAPQGNPHWSPEMEAALIRAHQVVDKAVGKGS